MPPDDDGSAGRIGARPLSDRLRRAVDGLPDGARISLQVRTLRTWIEEAETASSPESAGPRHLTTSEAAERLSVRPETVATWASEGRFPNAFKTGADGQSGEWRIPLSDLRAVRDGPQARSNGDRSERVHFDVGGSP